MDEENSDQTTSESGVEETTETNEEETVESIKAKLEEERKAREKAEEVAKNQKVRAEKAEAEAKKNKPEVSKDDLSSKDLYALMESKVHKDDVDEVVKMSKLLGKSVSESLSDQAVQSILAVRTEQRQIASATNTDGSKRVSTQVTGEALLAKAEKGELPDEADIEKLVKARFDAKVKK